MTPRNLWPFIGILFLIICSISLIAGTTGKIVGTVVDASTREPLPGVNIVIEGTTMGAASDLDGTFLILGVSPGIYTLRASMIGYRDMVVSNVRVNVDKTTRVDFRLQETTLELEETIEVVAERPMVKKDVTSTETSIGSDVIEALPVEDFSDVLNLQAGVIDGHFRGGRLGEVVYMIDGIQVNDVYTGTFAVEVENNAIQELNLISGTFDAEYGQAMSGVVNIVTKEGTEKFSGNLTGYGGSYFSGHDEIYWNTDDINLIRNLQFNLSGPIPFLKRMNFFINSRIFKDEGYIFGKRVFLPTDRSDFSRENSQDWVVESHGRQYQFSEQLADTLIESVKDVAMSKLERFTGNLKLTYRLTTLDKIHLETIFQYRKWREYDHRFRLNPDGDYTRRQSNITQALIWSHVFSNRTFMDLRYSYSYTRYKQFVYEDPFDSRYVSSQRLQDTGANAFLSGGQQMWHFHRSTTTHLVKVDITSQLTNLHQLKFGLEGRRHRLWLHEFEVVPELPQRIPPLTQFNHSLYLHHPLEASAYFQDKMEFPFMVVRAGLRFDYFDPDGEVLVDYQNPATSAKLSARTSSQFSPRFGIAYPISAQGKIHVSYGHFFQIPNFFFLYTNPEFDIFPLQSTPSPPPQSLLNTVGNAELKPQKTVIYEIGLAQQLGDDYALSATIFFKDIRNLLGTEVHITTEGLKYARYINRDYGFVRGVTFEFEKRYSRGVAASIDYTFQVAKGNASDPNTAFLDQQTDPPKETLKQVVPLDWDRRHQVNATITLGRPENFVITIVGRYGTGFPYTPTFQNVQTAVENSARKPDFLLLDIYANKNIKIWGLKYSLFLRVFNLLDRLNELEVFTDTGRAGYTLAPLYVGGLHPRGLNDLDDYFIRPDFYGEPRKIEIGFEVEF